MDDKVLNNIKSESRWLRLLFMALFYIVFYYFAGFIILVIASIQVVHGFITGKPNDRLLMLTSGINSYIHEGLQYISYNSDKKPYPFSDWPSNNGGKSLDERTDKSTKGKE